MKVKDLKIGTQLGLGFIAIVCFVIITGAIAFIQTDGLWRITRDLYEHPLTVRRAVGLLIEDILIMHRDMFSIALARDDNEVLELMRDIDNREAEAHNQFDVIFDRYLGPWSDVEAAHATFVEWKSIRDETIRLYRSGEREEAQNRVRLGGSGMTHVDKLMIYIEKISKFAKNKGDEFYQNAQVQKNAFGFQLAAALFFIFLLSLFIAFRLVERIRKPVIELSDAADRFRAGDFTARSRYQAGNEFGALSLTFNNLASAIQNELEARQNSFEISRAAGKEGDLKEFCRAVLSTLLTHTGSQSGAFYLPDDSTTEFRLFESIGLPATGKKVFSISDLEGEFGPVLQSKKTVHLKIDATTPRPGYVTSVGEIPPREIITIPLLANDTNIKDQVIAIISLSTVNGYEPLALRVVEDILLTLSARVTGALAFQKIKEVSARLEYQNTELQAQKKEMVVQTGELTQQNRELDQQKRQLDEANRLKSVFLSNMSHELRTPLNSVIALSGVLSRRLQNTLGKEEYGYLEVIERNGKQLLALINDILDLSRIEAGKDELSLQTFRLKDLVEDITGMMGALAREKGILLENLVPDNLPDPYSDSGKCRHILQNLVGNAIKFTDTGFVKIEANHDNGSLFIKVIDSGIGISEKHIPYIFDEFRQADESTSRKYGGTGLGLAIARRYANLMGGEITVTSSPGFGSVFTFRLPVGSAEHPESKEARPNFAPRIAVQVGSNKDKLILLVEDSEPAVIQMQDILGREGYRLAVARNGREAIELVAESVPDAMILDLMMPEVDGFEVLRSIRGSERTSQLPVLILSAKHVTKEELSFLKGNHVKQLIQKGAVSGDELLSAVANLVGSQEPQEKTSPAGTKTFTGRTPHSPPSILIVEDNDDNVCTLKALLGDTVRVEVAFDGLEGIRMADAEKHDLILLDISLPGIDGFETLQRLRSDSKSRDIPVIAITAKAMKGDREEILSAGFDGYVPKPIDNMLLHTTIQELIYGN